MEDMVRKEKESKIVYWFDRLAFILLIWSVFQDIVLGFLYTFIPSIGFINVLFYSKDVLMVLMFLYALLRMPHKDNKYFKVMIFYFLWVAFIFFYSLLVQKTPLTSAAASLRGFIFLHDRLFNKE